MSQVSIIDIEGNNPQIPTQFNANIGFAIPIGNQLNIYGSTEVPGATPVFTTGAGNTLTVNVQRAQAIAATNATNVGLSAFNSAQFTVDANGFVSIISGGTGIDSIGVQIGTNPITPTGAGLVTINGAVVAAGTNPVRSDGTGANTMAIEIQISQALAATDVTRIGLSNFNSAQFSVDANGFVSLAGGGLAVDSFTPNSGTSPVVPDAAGNIVLQGTGSLTVVGGLNSLTPQLTGLTNHAVLVGAGTATITNVGPTATIGQVLQSAGAAADPAFSTATYPLTTTINQILYSSAANTVTGLATANRAVFTTTAAGVPVATALATDGQVIVGSTAGAPAAATLTAGTGISITNASNSITIAASGGGVAWLDNSGSFTAAVNTGYFLTAASTPTLPAAPAQGDVCEFAVIAAATMTITANTGQVIRLDGSASAPAGTAVASTIGNTIKLVYRTADTTWWGTSSVGASWTIT